ncbi:hypothetical protein MRBLMI12_001453 [Microbacterium sp. LMI12-1-1.1]|uniref:Uncharacterized protein n=1 Tax=Microbacterium sp. LWS13-1.2 TaxID=3135264 RepID=A0AAU6SCH2_9MICO
MSATTRVTRRRGPLTALEGPEAALAIGDAAARHVRLTPGGLAPWLGDSPGGFMPWDAVRLLTVQPPTTLWPHPAIGDSVGPLLEGLLSGGGSFVEGAETPTFPVRVGTAGADIEWGVTQHYLSGYRRAEARATTRLAEYLTDRPEARVLLARPAELLDRIATLVRVRRPLIE